MTGSHRAPKAFVIDAEAETAEPVPRSRRKPRAMTGVAFEADAPEGELAVVPPVPLPSRRALRWGAILGGALASLFAMWAGLAAARLVTDFFAVSPYLGWIAAGLAVLAGLAALAIAFREIWGLVRLGRIEHLQTDAARAINHNDAGAAAKALAELDRLYRGRHDLAWGRRSLAEHRDDIIDAADRLRLAERYLVSPLDAEAHRIIARSARRVTLLTTVTPAAALDILFVAAQNLRMLRELATLYGGRPSTLATFKLARMVVGHLAVTGGLALSDSLIQHLIGKGLVGRLSARFGEGAVNGILTSRIGLAARDVCRPIPQEPSAKETLGSLLRELVSLNETPRAGHDAGQSQS